MNSNILLDAINTINDEYILSAQKCMDYDSDISNQIYKISNKRPARRTVVCIAAAVVMLLSSFTVAMAASEDFREFVFSIFNINSTEILPNNSENTVPDGNFEQIGASIDGAVCTYSFKGNGMFVPNDGIVYAGENDNREGLFYDWSENELVALPTTRVEFPFSFRETDFNIKFDYCVYDSVLHFRELPENLNENPYKYGWGIRRVGSDLNTALLFLPYETSGDYGIYPMLLDIETNNTTDILENMPMDEIIPVNWEFSDDLSVAVMSGYTEDYEIKFWICDVCQKTLTLISELTERTISNCYLLDDQHIICYAANENGFDIISFNSKTGIVTMLIERTEYYTQTGDGSGFRSIEYYGGYGRHALLFDDKGGITLVDLLSGKQTYLDGIEYDGTLLTSESPDGEQIMFAFRDTNVQDSLAVYKIGVLDTQTGVLKLLERTNYEIRNERPLGWLANNCIALIAYDEDEESGWYMYVYDFR